VIGNSVNVWQIACASGKLGAKPLALQRSGRHIVLFRDADGVAHALEDRCAHRQVPLSAGRVQGGNLECPYHGWQYSPNGEVALVPALGCPRKDIRISRFTTVEQDGFVWVCSLADEHCGPPQTSLPLVFPNKSASGWSSFVLQNVFRSTVEQCLENFLDCPHATFVHRYWFRAPSSAKVATRVTTESHGLYAEYFDEPRKKSAVWALLSPKDGTMKHTDRFIAPARSQVDYIFPNGWQYTISSSCSEIDSASTEVFTVISFKAGPFSSILGPLVGLYFEPLSKRIIQQDIDMLALQSDNVEQHSKSAGTPISSVSTQADLLGPAIVRWRKCLVQAAAKQPTSEIVLEPSSSPVREIEIYL
jgi:phenylpropionate dioxygenase-like ring-hydroxylating dioxygenase large terminal subunit